MKKTCVFCQSTDLEARSAAANGCADLLYWQCGVCHGIFLDPGARLTAAEEKKRYTLHENTLDDPGYRGHLEGFIRSVLAFSGNSVRTVFDYGSGPEPCLARLLEAHGFSVRYRDPFFAPDTPGFEGGADLVTCLEVAEHFAEPRRDFALMADCVREGGLLAVGTHLLLPESATADSRSVWDFFMPWWYRQDSTHISFYTPTALRVTAAAAGLEWLGPAGTHVWMFRKNRAILR